MSIRACTLYSLHIKTKDEFTNPFTDLFTNFYQQKRVHQEKTIAAHISHHRSLYIPDSLPLLHLSQVALSSRTSLATAVGGKRRRAAPVGSNIKGERHGIAEATSLMQQPNRGGGLSTSDSLSHYLFLMEFAGDCNWGRPQQGNSIDIRALGRAAADRSGLTWMTKKKGLGSLVSHPLYLSRPRQ